MTEAIISILGISILLYVLLGGADFGGGIIEFFAGRKGADIISRAMAPVWEANHIWIILAVVILFNGFPMVYTCITTYLHIPLLLVLTGIIIRGAAFTFRYYHTGADSIYNYYTSFFRISSLITPFFLGIVLGAIMLGRIPVTPEGSFYHVFLFPWLNLFAVTTGIFVTLLFGWIASVYLIGESTGNTFPLFRQTSYRLFIMLIISGLTVFLASEYYQIHLFMQFRQTFISMFCVVFATILIPFLWIAISQKNVLRTRLLAGTQTACIVTGWFAVQFPVMVYRAGGNNLTVWNTQATEKTMYLLLVSLGVGIVIIIPAFAYLFKIFKFSNVHVK